MNLPTELVQLIAIVAPLFALAAALFWMVVGWRAMRAHERIAAATEAAARKPSGPNP